MIYKDLESYLTKYHSYFNAGAENENTQNEKINELSDDIHIEEEIIIDEVQETTLNKRCKPGSVFKVKCNICRCGWDGRLLICTKKKCSETNEGNLQILILLYVLKCHYFILF